MLDCDLYHHYYHYQASAQYLWFSVTYLAQNKLTEAEEACTKAIFQDHFNQAALALKNHPENYLQLPLQYTKHPESDAEFCQSIGKEPTTSSALHDASLTADFQTALTLLNQAIELDPTHSNSYFAKGKLYFSIQDYAQAEIDFYQAIQLSHQDHNQYHQTASQAHCQRGKIFLQNNEPELAIADFSKALDLYSKNQEALELRSQLYQSKGETTLAAADLRKISSLKEYD